MYVCFQKLAGDGQTPKNSRPQIPLLSKPLFLRSAPIAKNWCTMPPQGPFCSSSPAPPRPRHGEPPLQREHYPLFFSLKRGFCPWRSSLAPVRQTKATAIIAAAPKIRSRPRNNPPSPTSPRPGYPSASPASPPFPIHPQSLQVLHDAWSPSDLRRSLVRRQADRRIDAPVS